MNNSVYGKAIKEKMSFWGERDIFKLMNDSVYCRTIKEKINSKNYKTYKNGFLEWKRSEEIDSKISIVKCFNSKTTY